MRMKLLTSVTVVCLLRFSHGAGGNERKHDDKSEKVYVARTETKDLDASATGYIFNRNGNNPGQYMNLDGRRPGLSSGFNFDSPLSNVESYSGSGFGPKPIHTGLNIASSRGLSSFSRGSGFNFPTKYNSGSTGGGDIGNVGLSEYNNVGSYEDFGRNNIGRSAEIGVGSEGLGYNGVSGNLVLGGIPQGNIGYGISKNGIGLAGLGAGLAGSGVGSGLGGRTVQTGSPGYGNINGAGPTHGQYIPVTVGLGELGRASGGGIANEASFAKGGGTDFRSGHEAAEGENGSTGYKVTEGFDKGEKGEVDNEHQAGGYSAAGGETKGVAEEANKYAENEVEAKGEQGESFSESAGHKKGHKTTGFHNVYHKDEYKKDTSFYDHDHVSGHEEKYGSEDAHHSEAEGAHEAAAKSDAAFHEDDHAKKGDFTNGHSYGAVQGHNREEEEKDHYDNEVEYAKRSNNEAEKAEGHSSVDHVKKIY